MRKKGFTLIELLASIAILSILMLVAVSSSMSALNKSKDNQYKTDAERAIALAEAYMRKGTLGNYPMGKEIFKLPLSLIDDGTFDKDPSGKVYDKNLSYVTVTNNGNGTKYPYEYNAYLIGGDQNKNRGVILSNTNDLRDKNKVVVKNNIAEMECSDISKKVFNGSTTGICFDVSDLLSNGNTIITYVLNGGSMSALTSVTVKSGTQYGTLPTPTRTGYSFNGWYLNDTGDALKSNDIIENKRRVNLYAKWTARKYLVHIYDLDGNKKEDREVTFDSSYGDLPTYEKLGYTHVYYSYTQGGAKNVEINGSTVKKASDHDLYAVGQLATYTIDYDLNGAISTGGRVIKTYTMDTASFELMQPEKICHSFAGWTGSNGTTPTKTVTISKGSTGNKSYKANWTAKTCKDDPCACKWVTPGINTSETYINYISEDSITYKVADSNYPISNMYDGDMGTWWKSRAFKCTSNQSKAELVGLPLTTSQSSIYVRAIAIRLGLSKSGNANVNFSSCGKTCKTERLTKYARDSNGCFDSLCDGNYPNLSSISSDIIPGVVGVCSNCPCNSYTTLSSSSNGLWYIFDSDDYIDSVFIRTYGNENKANLNVAEIKFFQ